MKKLLPLFLVLSIHCFAQPTIQWQKCYGGSLNDQTSSIQLTADGGFVMSGQTNSTNGDVSVNHGIYDYWLVKVDSSRNIQWQKSFGGTGWDGANSVLVTLDGGYIMTGFTESPDGDVTGYHAGWDFWIVKTDSAGNLQWQKALGGSGYETSYNMILTSDSGCVVVGNVTSTDGDVIGNHGSGDGWLVKLKSNGDIEWQKTLGGSSGDAIYSIQGTFDGGYVACGATNSTDGDITFNHGSSDGWIVKLDSARNIQWQKCYGGTLVDNLWSIRQTDDSGYIAVGLSRSNDGDVTNNHGNYDYWAVKTDSIGNIQWQKSLGGSDLEWLIWNVVIDNDRGYLIAGASKSVDGDITNHHGGYDYWIVKLDTSGTVLWEKSLGDTLDDYGQDIHLTPDGGYLVAGWSSSTTGEVSSNHGGEDCWIVKLALSVDIHELSDRNYYFDLYPNPAHSSFTVSFNGKLKMQNAELEIYDVTGRQVYSDKIAHRNSYIVNQNFSPGIYFVKVKAGGNEAVQKLIIQ